MARKRTTVLNGRALIIGILLAAATCLPSIANTQPAQQHGGGILRRVDRVETIMFGAARRDFPLHTRLQYIEGSAFGQPQSGGLASRVENVEKLLGTNEHLSTPNNGSSTAPAVASTLVGQRGKAGTYRATTSKKGQHSARTQTASKKSVKTVETAIKPIDPVTSAVSAPVETATKTANPASTSVPALVESSIPNTTPAKSDTAPGAVTASASSGSASSTTASATATATGDTILPKLDTFLDPNYSAPQPPPLTITERDSDGNPILQGNATENDPLKQSHFNHPFAPSAIPQAAQLPPVAQPRQPSRFAGFAGSVVGSSIRAGARSAARSALRAAISGGNANSIGAAVATSVGRAAIGSAVRAASRGPASAAVAASLHCPLCRLLP